MSHFTARRTSELIKYASNAFLAVKVSYINEMADLCEKAGVDVHEVARGMGIKSVALTAKDGGKVKSAADLCLVVPTERTDLAQEIHLAIQHAICDAPGAFPGARTPGDDDDPHSRAACACPARRRAARLPGRCATSPRAAAFP